VGDAYTLMSPEERKGIAAIERFLGQSIPRVEIPDFDYHRRPEDVARSTGGHGDGRRGSHGARDGRGSERRTSAEPQAPRGALAPETPTHGRRPVRNAPDRRRRRM
jgi:hypothetical protein